MNRQLLVAAVATLIALPATATDRFEVAEEISRTSLVRDYVSNRSVVDQLTKGVSIERCSDDAWKGLRCYKKLSQEQPTVFAAPFPAVAPRAKTPLTAEDFSWLFTKDPEFEGISWVPAKDVKYGAALFEEWGRMAAKATPFGCTGTDCMVFAEAFTRSSADSSRILSLCTVGKTVQKGPPAFCFPVASSLSGSVWIRAKVATSAVGGEGRPDFKLTFVLDRRLEGKAITKAVQQLLSDRPWQFFTELLPAGIRATAARRVSPIVTTVRESATVRVDVVDSTFHNRALGNLPFLKLEFSTVLYINELNTSRPEDWHLPSPEIQQTYVSRLLQAVKAGVAAACPNHYWIDDANATCGIPDIPERRNLLVGF